MEIPKNVELLKKAYYEYAKANPHIHQQLMKYAASLGYDAGKTNE